ncbi:MAG: hypothetical protein FWF12_02625 [Betaproteobacteria bacterium]|nr:hypothetical protein [Betaproteobacteria bacterium]
MQHGWYWLIEGFMLWVRNPAFLSFLTFCCIGGIILAVITPYVGELLGLILYPGLMLGVFNGCRAIDRKRTLSPGLLISGFRRYAFDLLLAGFCNFIVGTVMLLGTRLIDGGMMWRLVMHGEMPDLKDNTFIIASVVTAVLSVLWAAVYLFVPQLIGWWRLSVGRALLYSLKGCLLNWFPFFTYCFCFGSFIILLPALVINFFGLTFEGLGVVVCVVFLLITVPALIASFYVAARDIFGFPRRRKHKKRPSNPAQNARKKRRAHT